MTVNTTESILRATGIIDATPIAFPYRTETADEIHVFYGADIEATQDVHYSVAVAGDYSSATITPIAGFAALSGGTISIQRILPLTQPLDVPVQATLASSRLEQICDRLTMMVQQLSGSTGFKLSYPKTDPASAIASLPAAADRANKYMAFDANGKPIAATVVTAGALVVSAFGTTWVALANAASALTTLGFTGLTAVGKALCNAADAAAARAAIGAIRGADNIVFSGTNTFSGANDFTTGSINVPTAAPGTNGTTAASTAFANAAATAAIGAINNQSTTPPVVRDLTAAGSPYAPTAGTVWFKARWRAGGGEGGINVAGNNGSDTVFDGIHAQGGRGGGGAGITSKGGAGGTSGATAAVLRIPGAPGSNGIADGATGAMGGNGGGDGGGIGANVDPGAAGTAGTMGGGGGGGTANAFTGAAGGGGQGEYCEKIYSGALAPNYAFTVGAGGTGTAGADGGGGWLIVEEHSNH